MAAKDLATVHEGASYLKTSQCHQVGGDGWVAVSRDGKKLDQVYLTSSAYATDLRVTIGDTVDKMKDVYSSILVDAGGPTSGWTIQLPGPTEVTADTSGGNTINSMLITRDGEGLDMPCGMRNEQ